jgi:hypothetical protein
MATRLRRKKLPDMSGAIGTNRAQDDQQLVDLVSSVLVDPNLHTDLRMRLHEEITRILSATGERAPLPASRPSLADGSEPGGQHLPEMIQAVLSDPNLHTDMRMRLYGEIQEAVAAVHARRPR